VIKTGEADDPIGLLLVLSTQNSGAADKALQEFRAFLLRSIRDAADQEKLRAVSSSIASLCAPSLLSRCARLDAVVLTCSRG